MRSLRDPERRAAVIRLWHERYMLRERTEPRVLAFYGWLEQNRPELLPLGEGDSPYQQLQAELAPYVTK
jgi:hypothetical protein